MATKETKKTVVQIEIPDWLLAEAQTLVSAGWFRDLNELMLDALRRFLEFHRADMMEAFIRQDVEWGLSGKEVHSGPKKFDEEINS
jgi:Arc/MetJ-type ribon-helix-helix transcriptional regulator